VLSVDLRQRWRRGQRPPAEDYLRLYHASHDDVEYAVDLLYEEFLARRQRGEMPALEEYRRRFPALAGPFALQVGLYDALGGYTPGADPGGGTLSPLREGEPGPAPPPPPVPGYAPVRELGRGGTGVVYLAQQLRLQRPVALKVLYPDGPDAEADRARFRTEA